MFQKKRNTCPSNTVLKLRGREIGIKNKRLYCACDILKLHNQIQHECCTIPYQEQIRRRWCFISYFKYVSDMKRKFNEFITIEVYKTLSSQVSYCRDHNIEFKLVNKNKSVIVKTKWVDRIYFIRCDFNTSCTLSNKCQWMKWL
jgi:hypothetical protein